MTTSPTAEFLSNAIETSGLTQREIAQKAGFEKPDIISMMKLGETKVPIERIRALAIACNVEASDFLRVALQECHPEMWGVMNMFSSRS
ncbi:helix-turn-helix transcriptional regulator [Tropicimonas sp. IMCC6043]|uniref:helix-turn-helix domain-containing protein n=1 Tax=Tropicimonas sp. IMCC6043 TaxID=2510645 RepID=UPI00101CCC5E|nr:helix-turn-helix transcriptional regulator [Tropicimonas sp. IMCC6043]RYH08033.1 XRE family transcriptional regulator [Tropicimonas sp. IMCC6043]